MIAIFQNRKRFLRHQNRIFYRAQNLNRFIQFYSHLMSKYRLAANRRKKWSGEMIFLYPFLFLKSSLNQKIASTNTYVQQVNQQILKNNLISQKLNVLEKSFYVNFQSVFDIKIGQQFKSLRKVQSGSISTMSTPFNKSESAQSIKPTNQYQQLDTAIVNSIHSTKHHSQNFTPAEFRTMGDMKRQSNFNHIAFEYAQVMPKIAADGTVNPKDELQPSRHASFKSKAEEMKTSQQAMGAIQRSEVMDVNRMADQVYRLIQKKIQIENERRGRWY